ncbi:MAG: SAM-dependent chlorinase/fluorinase [Bacteroidales bacterium]|nr:SAM-dependent chlorinase/fluorinase [Bacteroidales bacterium]
MMKPNTYSMITLTTDFGLRDEYAGLMKGVIKSINPMVPVVDLTHYIPPQNVRWAAHLIYYSFRYFPAGSIHVIVVDPGVGSSRQIKLMKAGGHYFLFPDNGVITKIVNSYKPDEIWEINNTRYFLEDISSTFHGRDIFAPVAAHLSVGVEPVDLGLRTDELYTLDIPEPRVGEDKIAGHVIHVDQFGNLITNIEERLMRKLHTRYRDIVIEIGGRRIHGLSKAYIKVREGDLLATLGSKGLLEVSVNQGDASSYLGLGEGDEVEVTS